ncbi:hypothetical protein C5167_012810 [Papaver somniferum]|uniref:MATH domain-containing protein n=1 Tax=Papaver somniferum TaxID=3469 RepID=A0A4Y7J0I7_PAPSO|nr:hypothetical protein C5167_012810 [Papaver somniferum]
MGTKIVELPSTVKFIWKIDNFSKLYSNNSAYLYSDVFSAAGAKWKGLIYPKGSGKVFISVSLSSRLRQISGEPGLHSHNY